MTDDTQPCAELSALDQLQIQADALDAKAQPPSAPEPAAPAAPEIPTADVVQQVLSPAFALLCPAWGISDGETRALAEVYGNLIDKYFPGGVGALGCELSAALVTLTIFAPRWSLPRTHRAAPADGETAPTTSDPPPAPPKKKAAPPRGVPNPDLT